MVALGAIILPQPLSINIALSKILPASAMRSEPRVMLIADYPTISMSAKKKAISRRGILGAVRAMHGVRLDAFGELGADRAGIGLFRVGRAHDLAVARDRVLAFQHLHHDRAGRS